MSIIFHHYKQLAMLSKEIKKQTNNKQEDNKTALLKYGITESVADAFNGLYKGINDGLFDISKRTPATTIPTSFEDFANSVLRQVI